MKQFAGLECIILKYKQCPVPLNETEPPPLHLQNFLNLPDGDPTPDSVGDSFTNRVTVDMLSLLKPSYSLVLTIREIDVIRNTQRLHYLNAYLWLFFCFLSLQDVLVLCSGCHGYPCSSASRSEWRTRSLTGVQSYKHPAFNMHTSQEGFPVSRRAPPPRFPWQQLLPDLQTYSREEDQ